MVKIKYHKNNRLKYNGELVDKSLGYTKGDGSFNIQE